MSFFDFKDSTSHLINILQKWGITYHMAEIMGYKKQDKFIVVILIGIALAADSGADARK